MLTTTVGTYAPPAEIRRRTLIVGSKPLVFNNLTLEKNIRCRVLTSVRFAVYADYAMNLLGERIRELRDKLDLSLREFAKKLGDVSPAHIADIENGRRNPSDELLKKMAPVLGVSFEELKQLDRRLPVKQLRQAMRHDPELGFALRKLADKNVSSKDILKWAEEKGGGKGEQK